MKPRIGVLTSGGDAQGMNAAVRAVVRTALHAGAEVYAIREGWQGAVDGGAGITPLVWDDVSGILHRGGTVIGTARCQAFREREGQLRAAAHLLEHGIDRLVVVGGDGSLTGTDEFRRNWPGLLAELVHRGDVAGEVAQAHPALMIAGLVGSIDNDLVGSDMTIGADSALHRIVEAIDALSSTAASHQRSFVVEVMGRHCGYLPLMAAIAGGCDAVFVPEAPPPPGWEDDLCARLRDGRAAGRRDSLVLVAEGAQDGQGQPITAELVKDVIASRLGEDTRVTILGHVQRGGAPSAYDRWMSTLLGYAAVQEILAATPESTPHILGIRHNRIATLPLVETVQRTREVARLIEARDEEAAVAARGSSFAEMVATFARMSRPPAGAPTDPRPRLGVVHGGGLAPGMNTAARAAQRLGADRGFEVVGVEGGFPGLLARSVRDLTWREVDGWVGEAGAVLGTRRHVPTPQEFTALSRAIEDLRLDALLVVGGYNAYQTVMAMQSEIDRYPVFGLPTMLVPASIDNNLPGSELSIGCDTALNAAVSALDAVKSSAGASTRCFVAETMGRRCGYLTFMAGLASGAERVYLPEEGITLADLQADIEAMKASFRGGRRLFLTIRNELASDAYTTEVLARLFAEEGTGLFDVRQAVLGHLQQGGAPTPFDRILATRLVQHAVDDLADQVAGQVAPPGAVGLVDGQVAITPVSFMGDLLDLEHRRPRHQWWLGLRPALAATARRTDGPARAGVDPADSPLLRAPD